MQILHPHTDFPLHPVLHPVGVLIRIAYLHKTSITEGVHAQVKVTGFCQYQPFTHPKGIVLHYLQVRNRAIFPQLGKQRCKGHILIGGLFVLQGILHVDQYGDPLYSSVLNLSLTQFTGFVLKFFHQSNKDFSGSRLSSSTDFPNSICTTPVTGFKRTGRMIPGISCLLSTAFGQHRVILP